MLYRSLEKEHVDSFFSTGALRLSSFAKFATHRDEQRFDPNEGKGHVVHRSSEGQTMMATVSQGHNAYVLSASTSYLPDFSRDLETDSGFRINDSLAFGDAVSRCIPGFGVGLEGPCIYIAKRVLDRDTGPIDLESLRVSPGSKELDMGKLVETVRNVAGEDLYFLKLDKFSHQNEYRMLWLTPRTVEGHLDISCPEARQFCTRFEDLYPEIRK
jgi:hypothetical protein